MDTTTTDQPFKVDITKSYHGHRSGKTTADPGVVTVARRVDAQTIHSKPLKHLVRHSPTGMNWGYGGSGPADLARSILGDFLGIDDPHPALYQQFKFEKIAPLNQDGHWAIPADVIVKWLNRSDILSMPWSEERKADYDAAEDLVDYDRIYNAREAALRAAVAL
jgi:hypothetical protein